ncbi:MAG: phospho-N-acetylmuramoyl-pentapeptide-transferase [Erysipelothrix sp.]|nr:phospho-N-acetylmuramoyl-pentapeptide-transferase [Erysipelothrix sp.]
MISVVLSFLSSLILSWIIYPKVIPLFKKLEVNQTVSEYALDEFKEKPITPTLGGVVFVIISILVSFVFNQFNISSVAYNLCIIAFLGYALIGFIDDFKIIKEGRNEGLSPLQKIIFQVFIAGIFYYFYRDFANPIIEIFPFDAFINLGLFYALFIFIMFVSATNAVNITDGMDGLAGGTSFIALAAFLFFAVSQQQWEVAVLISSLMGALVGYLRVNFKPAQIIMGDCGSHALGGLMAAVAMVLKIEVLLIVIGGVFVWETATVILQIAAVKTIKRRIFKFTPIHYSFIISGYRENAIVLMFYIVGFICALIAIILGVM